MKTLLIEIGAEEIPAGYIKPALEALSYKLLQKMTDERIEYGEYRTFGTPKRVAIEVKNVADSQKKQETEVVGPPESVAFDKDGNLTIAGKKFAEKVSVPSNEIKVKDTKKGRYLFAFKTEETLQTDKVLSNILPELIVSLPFPKTMHWADLSIHFARPIISVTALLGDQVVPFELGSLQSEPYVFGHRFLAPGKFEISSPEQYVDLLESKHVIVDIAKRQKMIEQSIEKVAIDKGGQILKDSELVGIVTNLVEYPAVVAGSFDAEFLALPDEVLITAMREHQKYFAILDTEKRLMPYFIAVNNTVARDMNIVAQGHERVIRARLADAKFFYNVDLKLSLDSMVEKLKTLLFQAQLGSMYEKIERLQKVAEFIANKIDVDKDLKQDILRAAWLCKADLVSQVVIEFTKLQGVMGRVYASKAGESDAVAKAIEEHYRPTHSGANLPETIVGAVVAIADKIDSICGCFSIGLGPTGAADPYALRRQGIGLIQIMHDKGFDFSLKSLIETSLNLYIKDDNDNVLAVADEVYNFLKNRMEHILEDQGFSKDVILSVSAISVDHIPNVWNRVKALEILKEEPDFEPLAVAFKRVVNIIKKSDITANKEPEEALFEEKCESDLYSMYKKVQKSVFISLENEDFNQALIDIASLRGNVDMFFDGVMVMTDNLKLKENRLALLGKIAALFAMFADFSKISAQ